EKTSGFQPSEFILIAARPSVGKTSFALSISRHFAVAEGGSLFFASLEQSRIELANRLFCAHAPVDSHRLRRGFLDSSEKARISQAAESLRRVSMEIDDAPGQTVYRIASNARRLKLRKGIQMVLVDYLQLIESEDRRASRQEQVSEVSRRLKGL